MVSQSENPIIQFNRNHKHNNHVPSVPIYVYRQLVEDFNTTKIYLKQLKSENQALKAKNEVLQKELDKIIYSARNIQQIIDSNHFVSAGKSEHQFLSESENMEMLTQNNSSNQLFSKQPSQNDIKEQKKEQEYIFEVEGAPQTPLTNKQPKEIKSFWVVIVITLLVLSCSAGAFFLAISFIQNQNNNESK